MIIVRTLDNKITEQINEADLQKYIDLGYVAVSSDEIDMIEENGTTKWKYKSEDNTKYRTLSGGSGGGVDSVNGKTGAVVLTQDNIADGATYKQYSQAEKTKVSKIVTDGDGSQYLTNDGTYKTVSGGAGVTVYADLAAIKAVNTTSFTSGTLAQVTGLGQYVFASGSTITADDIMIIQPTTGGGRWIRQSSTQYQYTDYKTGTTNIATITEAEDTYIPKKNKIGKKIKIVAMGSSVCYGTGATTVAQGYANLLRTSLEGITDVTITTDNISVISTTPEFWREHFTDLIKENPDVVVIGLSTNNNSLWQQTTVKGTASVLKIYIDTLHHLTSLCDKHQIEYFIVGEYGYTGTTAIAATIKNQFNAQLAKFKNVINVMGEVCTDALDWKTAAKYNEGHPNDTGHLGMLRAVVQERIYKNRGLFTEFKPSKRMAKLVTSASDTTVVCPIVYAPADWSGSTLESWTVCFDVRQGDGTYSSARTLCKVKSTAGNATATVDINTSGYFVAKDSTTVKSTSSIKINKYDTNRVVITSDVIDNMIYVFVDDVLVSSFTPALGTALYNVGFLKDNLTSTTRADGFEISNIVIYQGRMDLNNIHHIFRNNYPQAGIVFAHNMEIVDSEMMLLSQFGNGTYAVFSNGTSTFTNVYDGNNEYTDTEKKKLGNMGLVGTAVASETSITAPSTIFHVTGTTAISTINVPYTGFTGNITIIPDAIFTLATGGNIYEAYTAVVGRAIQLCYDGTTWYRVNAA